MGYVRGEQPQSMLLRQLGPPDGTTQSAVFGDDYSFIHQADDAKGQIGGVSGTFQRIVLVPVPNDVKAAMTGSYHYPAPVPDWALILSVAGPNSVILTKPDGTRQTLSELAANYHEDVFVAGEFKSYPGTSGISGTCTATSAAPRTTSCGPHAASRRADLSSLRRVRSHMIPP